MVVNLENHFLESFTHVSLRSVTGSEMTGVDGWMGGTAKQIPADTMAGCSRKDVANIWHKSALLKEFSS